ncbi:hypothetical protein TrispH2_009624 [Trichoplax sp. H2]|nr:hypothetical protein TrispH2_009624 [Trichoplax sp. H2]|eukprot:RDD37821.1 hypothetical protein TrispH2_009624 [Trichoplax sp. H2]
MADWIDNAKDDILQSKDWQIVSNHLYDAVQQQMKEFHVPLFSELNQDERDLCINRALKLIEQHESYHSLFKTVSTTLEQALLTQIRLNTQDHSTIAEEHQGNQNKASAQPIAISETDLLLQYSADSAAKLLEKRPQFRKKLYLCFNRCLPKQLRHTAWKLQLRNQSIYQDSFDEINKLQNDRQQGRYLNIKQRCKAIIHTEPLFATLALEANLPDAMEIILSYRQLHLNKNTSLVDTDYLLLLPFLYLKCGCWKDCTIDLIACTIEYYTTFIIARQELKRDGVSQKASNNIKDLAKTVIDKIKALDIDLSKALQSALASPEETAKPLQNASIYQSIATILRPLVRSLFVGFLPMEVVCFIWDQIIIGMSNPKFDCIPAFCISILLSLRQSLMECKTIKAVEQTILKDSRTLTVQEVQFQIQKYFYEDLRSTLIKRTTSDDIPIVDPIAALSQLPGWNTKAYNEPLYDQLIEERKAKREEIQDQRRQKIKDAEQAAKLKATKNRDTAATPVKPDQQHADRLPEDKETTTEINEPESQVNHLKDESQKSKLAVPTNTQSGTTAGPEKSKDQLQVDTKIAQDQASDDELQKYTGRGIFDDESPGTDAASKKPVTPAVSKKPVTPAASKKPVSSAVSARTHLPSILFDDEG